MKIYFTSRNRSASNRIKIRKRARKCGDAGDGGGGVCVPESQGDGGTSCYGLNICLTLKFIG